MKFISIKGVAILLTGSFIWTCQPSVPGTPVTPMRATPSEAELIQLIGSPETIFSRESEFVKRPFEPFLDGKWIGEGISYGCYRKGQSPDIGGPSEAEILEDLNILSPYWNFIRVYGSDDDSQRLLKVIDENKLPFKVILGAWIANETKHPERKIENVKQVSRAIVLANRYPDIIAAVSVGNESQVDWSWHRTETPVLVRYIRAVRQNIEIPVTTADDYNFWNKPHSTGVADEIDFIILHAYALWNGLQLENAVSWTDSVYKDIQGKHPEQQIIFGETGWATTYNPQKLGPGEQGTLIKGKIGFGAQERFITDFWNWSVTNHIVSFYFEAFDEPWKGGGDQSGPDEIEKHWGVFYEDRTPKESFSNYLNKQTHKK